MRLTVGVAVLLVSSGLAVAQTPPEKLGRRYKIEPDADLYPQATPQECLASVLKAMANDRMDYLMAQLADPDYVDERVRQVHGGRFEALVQEAQAKLAADPGVMKRLRRFLEDGQWSVPDSAASARLKGAPEQVFFRKLDGRWFFDNRKTEPPAKEK